MTALTHLNVDVFQPVFEVLFSNGRFEVFYNSSVSDVISSCNDIVGNTGVNFHIVHYSDFFAYIHYLLS